MFSILGDRWEVPAQHGGAPRTITSYFEKGFGFCSIGFYRGSLGDKFRCFFCLFWHFPWSVFGFVVDYLLKRLIEAWGHIPKLFKHFWNFQKNPKYGPNTLKIRDKSKINLEKVLFLHISKFWICRSLETLKKAGTGNKYEDPFKQILKIVDMGPISTRKYEWTFGSYLPENMKWNSGNLGSIKVQTVNV